MVETLDSILSYYPNQYAMPSSSNLVTAELTGIIPVIPAVITYLFNLENTSHVVSVTYFVNYTFLYIESL